MLYWLPTTLCLLEFIITWLKLTNDATAMTFKSMFILVSKDKKAKVKSC